MKNEQKKSQRLLGRVLAKELSREELEQVSGSRPPISTLVATGPNHTEDE